MSSNKPVYIDFCEPRNAEELALFIGVDPRLLEIATDPERKKQYLFRHRLWKRSKHRLGSFRTVWEAAPFLADSYKSFARRFDLFVRFVEPRYPQHCSYGYVRGRSTIDNALGHCGAPQILHADIKNFFGSISAERLHDMFSGLGINNEVSRLLTAFLTIEGALPLGLHPSPMLANIVCLNLDDKFADLASRKRCTYTRYADDITLSSKKSVPTKEEVEVILEEEGFLLNARKFRVTKLGQAHYVTGLSVSDPQFPRAPRAMKKKLRQELFYCRKFGVTNHLTRIDVDETIQKGVNRIDGFVKYIAHIEKDSWPKLRKDWEELLDKEYLGPSFEPLNHRRCGHFDFYVDETEFEIDGGKFLALSFVKTEDSASINFTTISILRHHLANPYADGKKATLRKKGLHFVDATEDLKKAYVDKLSILPFRAYLAFREITQEDEYENIYLSLVEELLPHRLMSCDRANVNLIFEENSKIKKSNLEHKIDEIFGSLVQANNRRPIRVETIIGAKAEYPCFSVPDFMLGIFRGYAENRDCPKTDRRHLLFEQLRDRYRIILDADHNIVYSRKRPFGPTAQS